jgi:hypothetical protein
MFLSRNEHFVILLVEKIELLEGLWTTHIEISIKLLHNDNFFQTKLFPDNNSCLEPGISLLHLR